MFDWDADTWERAGRRALELVERVSTDWAERRPGPEAGPEEILASFREPLPTTPTTFEAIADRLEQVAKHSAFIGHPRWMAYITASPNPVGVLGDLVTSAINPNLGLWRAAPAATAVELQSIDWLKEMLGYPAEAEGVYTSGGQFASIVAHAVIRNQRAGWDVRREGFEAPNATPLRTYASAESHYCHQQAANLLGLGTESVRLVPVDEAYRMRLDMLGAMIAEDRRKGYRPISIVATAGTVGTGAVDPIPELVELARSEGLWLHIDGAYGAFAVIAPSSPASLRAMAEADSIACDPHKWLYAPIDAGALLIRRPGLLAETFSFHAPYLHAGEADARIDLAERGPENSRRARGIKVWMALLAAGRDGYRGMIEQNLRAAARMEEAIRSTESLALAAPRDLSIVCWRVVPAGVSEDRLDDLQIDVMNELERRGIAIISNARLRDGHTALRACIVNFRTRDEDVEAVVAASAEIGRSISRSG
ncbi:MAG TPA: aminotransferase class V-fold PLP-dependent enzyme [Candidatus Dormibacteraeota bacterium]|nr:aminotransferase class V-fold PLP-dependent enzyme [Candidatus Dormibacteraeota bacterium]